MSAWKNSNSHYYKYPNSSIFLRAGILLLILSSTGLPVLAQSPQDKAIVVKLDRHISTDPLTITRVGDDSVAVVSPTQSEQRLNDLRITVHNDSPKAIVALTVAISFPESGDGTPESPIVGADVRLGNMPDLVSPPPAGLRPPLLIAPGEDATLNVTPVPASYKPLLAVSRLGSVTPSVCYVRLQTIAFEDGTRYFGGAYQRRDQTNPSHFSTIPPSGYMPANK